MHNYEELRNQVIKKVDSVKEELIRIAKYIHDNPELGYEEFKALERK